MAHEKDVLLAIKQVVGLNQRDLLLERLRVIKPVNDQYSNEQLNELFDGMPDLKKVFCQE